MTTDLRKTVLTVLNRCGRYHCDSCPVKEDCRRLTEAAAQDPALVQWWCKTPICIRKDSKHVEELIDALILAAQDPILTLIEEIESRAGS
jgi:hypothetical protein